jgi:hypothetical protein
MLKRSDSPDGDSPPVSGTKISKKPYQPPQLVKYGSVARLTTGVNGSHFDPGHNNNSKQGSG